MGGMGFPCPMDALLARTLTSEEVLPLYVDKSGIPDGSALPAQAGRSSKGLAHPVS